MGGGAAVCAVPPHLRHLLPPPLAVVRQIGVHTQRESERSQGQTGAGSISSLGIMGRCHASERAINIVKHEASALSVQHWSVCYF